MEFHQDFDWEGWQTHRQVWQHDFSNFKKADQSHRRSTRRLSTSSKTYIGASFFSGIRKQSDYLPFRLRANGVAREYDSLYWSGLVR